MSDLTKDREEAVKVAVDFSAALDAGDSLSTVSSVEVTEDVGGTYTDRSAEFGSPTGTIASETVELTLGAASGSDQAASVNYIVRVTVATANGETLVGTPSLAVTAIGDTDAP